MSKRVDRKILETTGVSLEVWLTIGIKHGLSSRELARRLDMSETSIRNYAKKYGLKLNCKAKRHPDWGWYGCTDDHKFKDQLLNNS